MKYIIMCGGNYPQFSKPKQLMIVNGEILVERTIRLLKENGINDITICTNCNKFDYLKLPILKQNNKYVSKGNQENKKSECCWLNAFYLLEEPCCYIYGDVYFSDEAIKTIVKTKVKNTMFFCVQDIQDGRQTGINAKGREPLAYKVKNNKKFNNAVNDLLRMVDEKVFENAIPPFSWHLYRYLNNLNYISDNLGYINNIFETKGDYVVINDYTTDVDNIEDIKKIEKIIKIYKGEIKMIKVEVIEKFHLDRFNELKNIVRKNKENNEAGELYIGDTFECDQNMAKYLLNEKNTIYPTDKDGKNNSGGRPFVDKLEVIPAKKEEPKKTQTKTTTKTTTRKRTTKKKEDK